MDWVTFLFGVDSLVLACVVVVIFRFSGFRVFVCFGHAVCLFVLVLLILLLSVVCCNRFGFRIVVIVGCMVFLLIRGVCYLGVTLLGFLVFGCSMV